VSADELNSFEWAIVEIFGHRSHAGRAREEEKFGAKLLRIDVPTLEDDGYDRYSRRPLDLAKVKVASWETHYYGGSSIFSYTPSDELTVMKNAVRRRAVPAIPYREPNPEAEEPVDAEYEEAADRELEDGYPE